jgi:DNA-binding response OmpR family regulator
VNKLPEAPCNQAAAKPDGGRANPPHRILVVEDDRPLRQINPRVLIHSGYTVNGAEDGAAIWEVLHATRYDLLITDNNMPMRPMAGEAGLS